VLELGRYVNIFDVKALCANIVINTYLIFIVSKTNEELCV